jgi:hypothetical protein
VGVQQQAFQANLAIVYPEDSQRNPGSPLIPFLRHAGLHCNNATPPAESLTLSLLFILKAVVRTMQDKL